MHIQIPTIPSSYESACALDSLPLGHLAVTVAAANEEVASDVRADCQEGSGLIARQQEHVRRCLVACRCLQLEWLFHLDDDELLHLNVPLSDLSHADASCLVFLNVEAIPTQIEENDEGCVFEAISTFTRHELLSYQNGKSAGSRAIPDRVHHPAPLRARPCLFPPDHGMLTHPACCRRTYPSSQACSHMAPTHELAPPLPGRASSRSTDWYGPHRFSGVSHQVPLLSACVLHFESCLYTRWRDKFLKQVSEW